MLTTINAGDQRKIKNRLDKNKIDEIAKLISVSDDLNKHRTAMARAALKLVETGKCSHAQIKEYGGWVTSGQRSGQYFMDCGKQRVWFNPSAANTVYADRSVPETKAREMCQNAIKREALTKPKFHFFDTSYTVHNPRKAVTYIQGFEVVNAFGAKIKYRAFCLIQPSGNLELSLVVK